MKRLILVASLASVAQLTSLWAGLQAPFDGPPNTPPPKASIAGIVVRVGTGEPISRAQVTMTRVASGLPTSGPAAADPANAGGRGARPLSPEQPSQTQTARQPGTIPVVITDDQGKFLVRDLEPGSYRVVAARNGFTKQEYGQRSFNRPGVILNIRAGQQIQDITFRLTPAPTISGRVVDAVTGEPLSGITVQALRSTYDGSGKRTLQSSAADRTNDLGEYRLYWINPGHYYVSADAAPSGLGLLTAAASQAASQGPTPAESQAAAQAAAIFGPSRTANEVVDSGFLHTYYPGTPDISKAVAIELQPGAEMRSDFSLVRGERFRIRGRVIDAATGRPPRDASLSVSPRNAAGSSPLDPLFGGLTGMLQGNKYNSSTGEFEVRDVVAGSYWLQVMAQAQTPTAPVITDPVSAANSALSSISTTQIPVDVFGGNLDNLTLLVSSGVTIRGRVRIEGSVSPTSNAFPPNAPASVALTLQSITGGSSILSMLGANVRPAPDGTFSIPRVAPGEYILVVNGLSPTTFVKEARLDQIDVLQGITISDRVDGSLEIVLSPNGGQIDGTVIGADLKPVSGVQAVLVPNRLRNRQELYKTAVTNQDGRFTIRGITPGDYRLFAWEDIEPFAYFDPEVSRQYEVQGKPVRIEESAKEMTEVKLIPAGQ